MQLRLFTRKLFSPLLSLFLFATVFTVQAEWRSGPLGRVYLNLPPAWKIHELRDDKVSATNKAEEAFFILRYYEGDRFDDVADLDSFVRAEIAASAGKGDSFLFAGRDAAYGEVEFMRDGSSYRGVLLCVEGHDIDLSALAFTSAGGIEAYEEMLVSVIDSISFGHSGLLLPGAVSRVSSPYPARRDSLHHLRFEDIEIPVVLGEDELEASQELIEREARLLSLYGGTEYAVEAWKRYYRLLYRDLYARSAPFYTALRQYAFDGEETDREVAERLLRWLQGFEYRRLDTMSDCLSPLKAAVGHIGDCDSRGLLYVILLHYFDIDALLMVSSVYSHGMVAVDIGGEGARFPYEDKKYMVAETTDDVDIGRIDRNMSNIDAWIGIDFIRFSGTSMEPVKN